jgi:hypothetical protein
LCIYPIEKSEVLQILSIVLFFFLFSGASSMNFKRFGDFFFRGAVYILREIARIHKVVLFSYFINPIYV